MIFLLKSHNDYKIYVDGGAAWKEMIYLIRRAMAQIAARLVTEDMVQVWLDPAFCFDSVQVEARRSGITSFEYSPRITMNDILNGGKKSLKLLSAPTDDKETSSSL